MSKIRAAGLRTMTRLYDAIARPRNAARSSDGGERSARGVPRRLNGGRALALGLAAAALATACTRPPGAGHLSVPPAGTGLSTDTAFVTLVTVTAVQRTSVRLAARDAASVLAAAWRLVGTAPDLALEPDGTRLLANLRLDASLVDISIWDPQSLVLAGRRVGGVSGIVIPLSGAWHGRAFVVQEGTVQVTPAFGDADMAVFEAAVAAAAGHS